MTAILLTLGMVASSLGQVAPQAPAEEQAAAVISEADAKLIADAVRELGDERFAVRQRAAKWLWQQGLAAEPALKKAAESGDGETRLRARRILDDFKFGIVPGAPEEIVTQLRNYRDGDEAVRAAAFDRLVERAQYDVAERLLKLENDAELQRNLMLQMFGRESAVAHFLKKQRLEELIASFEGQRDKVWRQTVLSQMMFSELAVQWLTDNDQLDRLVKVIEGEAAAEARRTQLSMLFDNPGSIAALVSKGQLDFLLKLAAREPDEKVRAGWMGQIVSAPNVLEKFVKDKGLDKLLEFIEKNIAADARSEFYQRLYQNPTAVTALLEKIGFDGLVAAINKVGTGTERGELLALLMAQWPIRQHLREDRFPQIAIELAQKEKDPAARGQYLQTLLMHTGYYLLRDNRSRRALLDLVKAADGQDWRAEVIVRLLQSSSGEPLFRTKEEALWLLTIAEKEMTEGQRQQLLENMSWNQTLLTALVRHDAMERVVTLAKSLPVGSRGSVLARVAGSHYALPHWKGKNQLVRLVEFADEEKDEDCRRSYLTSLFVNGNAMQALIGAGFFDRLWAFVEKEPNAVHRAALLAEFIQSQQAMAKLVAAKRLEMLLEYARDPQYAEARQSYLLRLYSAHWALQSLLAAGKYDELLALAKAETEPNAQANLLSQFYFHPVVLQKLLAEKKVGDVLKFAQTAEENSRRNLLQRLYGDEKTVAALINDGHLETMIRLIRQETQNYYRGSMFGNLLGSQATMKWLVANNQVGKLFDWVNEEQDAEARRQMTDALIRRPQVAAALIEQGHFGRLLDLVRNGTQPESQGELLASLIQQQPVLKALIEKKQLGLLLRGVNELQEANSRIAFMQNLVNSEEALDALFKQGHFNDLLDLANSPADPSQRIDCQASFLMNSKTIQYLVAHKQIDLLLATVRGQADDSLRRLMLIRLMQHEQAVQTLVAEKKFVEVAGMCLAAEDAAMRRRLSSDLLMSATAIAYLAETGNLDEIVRESLTEPDANIRHEIARQFFSYGNSITALIDKGYYDKLFALANEEQDKPTRAFLLSRFYANQTVLNRLVEAKQLPALLAFVTKDAPADQRRDLLQQLLSHEEALAILIASGQVESLFALIQEEGEAWYRGNLYATLFNSPAVIDKFIEQNQIDKLFDLIEKETDDNSRQRIWSSLTGRVETLDKLLSRGLLDRLLAIADQFYQPYYRGQYTATLLTHAKTLELLVKEKRLNVILDRVAAFEDENVSVPYLSQVFGNPNVIEALLKQHTFEDLLKVCNGISAGPQRAQALSVLLSNHKMIEHLLAKDGTQQFLDAIRQQPDEISRRQVLQPLVYNDTLMAKLIEKGLFAELLKVLREDPDPGVRQRLLAELLASSAAVEQLAKSGELEPIFNEALTSAVGCADDGYGGNLFYRLLQNSRAVLVLLDKGLFDKLHEAAKKELNEEMYRQAMASLVSNSEVTAKLVQTGRMSLLLEVLANETEQYRRYSILNGILANRDAFEAVMKSDRAADVLTWIRDETDNNLRAQYAQLLLANPAGIEFLLKHEQGQKLLEQWLGDAGTDGQMRQRILQTLISNPAGQRLLVEPRVSLRVLEMLEAMTANDPFGGSRVNYVRQIVTNPAIWKNFIAAGQWEALKKIAAMETDENLREQSLRRILYSPSGLLGYHIARGELDAAQKLFEDSATDELGRLRLASWLTLTGRGDARIAELQVRAAAPGATLPADEARLLVYLLRAKGDLPAAIAAARITGDNSLLKGLLVEHGDFAEAAKLQSAGPLPPVIPFGLQQTPGNLAANQRMEQLGLLAAYQRLAGDDAALAKTISEIGTLADSLPADTTLQWFAVEALLLNDQFDAGLKRLETSYPLRAADMFSSRYEYGRALALAGWQPGVALDRKWLDALPAKDPNPQTSAMARFDFGLFAARLLHMVGETESARQAIDTLLVFADEQPNPNSSAAPRRQCWEKIALALVAVDDEPRAWQVAALGLFGPDPPPAILSRLFPGRYESARGWWSFFRAKHAGEPVTATFARVHAMMNPPANEDAAAFEALVDEIEARAKGIDEGMRKYELLAAAHGSAARDRLDLAHRCLAPYAAADGDLAYLLGLTLRKQDRWAEAAVQFKAAWDANPERLAALYLSGDSLVRGGEEVAGRRRMETALLLAIDAGTRRLLAMELSRVGLTDAADGQYELLLRIAPPEHLEWHEAARHLGERPWAIADPALAARRQSLAMLDDLRTNFYFLSARDYLAGPANFHRMSARAAIAAGDFAAAEKHIERALVAGPTNSDLSEELVPLLESVGRKQQADEMFERQYAAYQAAVERFPKSALLHNNIAWLAARSSRRLDDALTHATKAVELSPDNAGHIDTLAEVHFRRGDRDTAVQHSRRALALKPRDETLQKQLHRFEHDPLPGAGK